MEDVIPVWRQLLQSQLNNKRTVQQIADDVGLNRSTLSAIINRTPSSPYVNGKSSTKGVEDAVMRAFGGVICPHLEQLGICKSRITRQQCAQNALGPAPMGNLVQMEQWRACQGCEHKPTPIKHKVPVPRGPKSIKAVDAGGNQSSIFEMELENE
jgi:hypothetical protein